MLSDEELRAIRERCQAATPGPWGYDGQHDEITAPWSAESYWIIFSECRTVEHPEHLVDEFGHQYNPDFALMAAARQDIPALLALIDAWAPVIKAAREEKAAWEAWMGCQDHQEWDLLRSYNEARSKLHEAVARLEE